jgi:hypothetical protein
MLPFNRLRMRREVLVTDKSGGREYGRRLVAL